jgi:hypothetical protein
VALADYYVVWLMSEEPGFGSSIVAVVDRNVIGSDEVRK